MKCPVIDYDVISNEYDEHYQNEMSKKENQAIIDSIGSHISKCKRILDLGCGTGFLIDLFPMISVEKYLGIDISSSMIKIAKNKYPTHSFIDGVIEDISDSIGKFDVIVSLFSIPYIDTESINHIYDVLESGGWFIGVYYDKPYLNSDSVYYNNEDVYNESVKPKVDEFIDNLVNRFTIIPDTVNTSIIKRSLTDDETYSLIMIRK